MTAKTALPDQNRAILMMVASILCITLMDANVKAITPETGVLPALWIRYAGQMIVVTLLISLRLKQVARTRYPVQQALRSVLLMCSTGLFFMAVSVMPLSGATALMMLSPVLITLGAAMFLGEPLGPRRIFGIVAALIGAIIVVRPGSNILSTGAIYPLLAAMTYTGYVLLTRRIGSDEDPWTSLFYTGLVGTVILTLIAPAQWQSPATLSGWGQLGLIVMFGTLGQLFLIRAFSTGEAAMLAPYSYCGLIFAATWGFLFFGELPDFWTICGALVIVAAGLYVWHRETRSLR